MTKTGDKLAKALEELKEGQEKDKEQLSRLQTEKDKKTVKEEKKAKVDYDLHEPLKDTQKEKDSRTVENFSGKEDLVEVERIISSLENSRKRQEQGVKDYYEKMDYRKRKMYLSDAFEKMKYAESLIKSAERGGVSEDYILKNVEQAVNSLRNSKAIFESLGKSKEADMCEKLITKAEHIVDKYGSNAYGKREPELVTLARKVESEENRMPRALAWAKKEIDNMARKEADKIKNNSVGYLERLENQLDLKRKGKMVETESRLMESLKKEQEDLSEKVIKSKDVKSASVTVYNTQIEKISRNMDQANQRLMAAQKEYDDAMKTYMQYANSKMAQDRESAKEIIKGIVSQVHSRACEKFGIKNPYNRDELRRSLEDFGESEAAHMAENEYKTIYSGWGRIRKYAGSASGYYKSAAGGAARVNDLIDKISDGVKVLLFGPMVIGAAIMMSAAWILETYGAESSSPLFIVFFFITIFAFAMLEIGRAWKG